MKITIFLEHFIIFGFYILTKFIDVQLVVYQSTGVHQWINYLKLIFCQHFQCQYYNEYNVDLLHLHTLANEPLEWKFSSCALRRRKENTTGTCIGPFTLAKTKIQKTWVFCCTVYTARKTHNIRGFWHEKRMREKTRISYLCFGKWCACATSLYLWPYTGSALYVAGRGRVIPLKVTYHVTKNPNNTGEIGASVYIGKKTVKFRRSFKKSRCGGGFFDSGFLECLGEVA